MNLTIDRTPALAALSRVTGVVDRKHTIHILSNVLISADGDALTLRASDLEMEAVETLAANVESAGSTTIPADKLHDIVRNADSGAQVSVTLDGSDPRAKVKSGRSRFSLPVLSADSFPAFDASGLGEEFKIPAKTLADMLSRSSWMALPLSNPPLVLNCTFLTVHEGELHAIACQNSGIALRREPAPEGAAISTALAPKLVGQIIKWLSAADGDAFVSSSDRLIRIRHAGGMLTGTLYDSQYVDYRRLLMESHELSARTDQDALKTAITRAMIVADNRTLSVKLTFTDGGLSIQARNDLAGEGADEIGCEYEGPDVSFLLSAGQLLQALGALRGDIVEFAFAPERVEGQTKTAQVIVRAPADPGLVANLMQPRA